MTYMEQSAIYEQLEEMSLRLSANYADEDAEWQDSPFAWIKSRPSRQRGKICEELVAGLCDADGLRVSRSPDSEADLLVEGVRVEVKSSTLWKNGRYKFQQLRDQNYQIAVCLGLSPAAAHCWALPKELLLQHWRGGSRGISSQHGGRGGTDTAWIELEPLRPPTWMQTYGGSLENGLAALQAALASFRA